MKLLTFFLTLACAAYAQHGRGAGQGMPRMPASTGSSTARTHDEPETRGMAHAQQPHITDQNKVVRNINRNPQLAARVQQLLPPGMTLQQAAEGFKNQGQFIAALRASRNLKIPFPDLKAKMTGPHHESLGRAIHELRPDLDDETVKQRAATATEQAEEVEQVAKAEKVEEEEKK